MMHPFDSEIDSNCGVFELNTFLHGSAVKNTAQ